MPYVTCLMMGHYALQMWHSWSWCLALRAKIAHLKSVTWLEALEGVRSVRGAHKAGDAESNVTHDVAHLAVLWCSKDTLVAHNTPLLPLPNLTTNTPTPTPTPSHSHSLALTPRARQNAAYNHVLNSPCLGVSVLPFASKAASTTP